MRRLFLAWALLLPAVAVALEFADHTERYADAPFSPAETAGISVLTALGAVEGNPDGTFAPQRTLNRAEFLKIVLRSLPRSIQWSAPAGPPDAPYCFPDVKRGDWFSPYVCYAHATGAVQGYPDGFFRPDRPVNYAEALKMLGTLYRLRADVPPDSDWFVPYREGAYRAGVGIPGLEQDMGHLLTRGDMARLAAAYRAHAEGQLDAYRAFENGGVASSSTASSASSGGPSLSSASSEAPVTSSLASSRSSTPAPSSAASIADFPARSHLLLLGAESPPIVSGIFDIGPESRLQIVTVEFDQEAKSIGKLFLVDRSGATLAALSPDVYDARDRTWRAALAPGSGALLSGTVELGVTAMMRGRTEGGFAEEYILPKKFHLTLVRTATGENVQLASLPPHPPHQTVQGVITSVRNAAPATGVLVGGNAQVMGAFLFEATAPPDIPVRVETLVFTVDHAPSVHVQNWRLRRRGDSGTVSCSMNTATAQITCGAIPASTGTIVGNAMALELLGDVTLGSGDGQYLQVSLREAGSPSAFGAVQWTDGSGTYRWVELPEPLAEGTLWQE